MTQIGWSLRYLSLHLDMPLQYALLATRPGTDFDVISMPPSDPQRIHSDGRLPLSLERALAAWRTGGAGEAFSLFLVTMGSISGTDSLI